VNNLPKTAEFPQQAIAMVSNASMCSEANGWEACLASRQFLAREPLDAD